METQGRAIHASGAPFDDFVTRYKYNTSRLRGVPFSAIRAWIDDWQAILRLLAEEYPADTFLVDSCPFAVCHNQRAHRSRLYQDAGGAYWGHGAAKKESFYGLRAHTIVTSTGHPVEVLLLCGCSHDLTGLKERDLNLPPAAV